MENLQKKQRKADEMFNAPFDGATATKARWRLDGDGGLSHDHHPNRVVV